MLRYGKNLTEQELEAMIEAHDLTKNHKLNYEEFKTMMIQEKKVEKLELGDEELIESDSDDEKHSLHKK